MRNPHCEQMFSASLPTSDVIRQRWATSITARVVGHPRARSRGGRRRSRPHPVLSVDPAALHAPVEVDRDAVADPLPEGYLDRRLLRGAGAQSPPYADERTSSARPARSVSCHRQTRRQGRLILHALHVPNGVFGIRSENTVSFGKE
jgi:hypothetical protein